MKRRITGRNFAFRKEISLSICPFSAVDPNDEVGRRKIIVMSVIIALTIVGNGYILISIICKARQ